MKLFILFFGDWGSRANVWFAWNMWLAFMFGLILGITVMGLAGE